MAWGTIAATLGAGALGFLGQKETNQQNAAMADKQMGFQKMMSDTAHQREVEDLKAAGLNPILSANAGASTPGGSMAHMENALDKGISSALAVRSLKADLEQKESQTALNKAAEKVQQINAVAGGETAKQMAMKTLVDQEGLGNRIEAERYSTEGLKKGAMIDASDFSQTSNATGRILRNFFGIGNSARDITR